MWTTSQSGINEMLGAAALAPAGQRREAALDALNAWIGSPIRLRLIQFSSGFDNLRQERTHASGMTRSGEELIVPTSGWTSVVNNTFTQQGGPLRVRIERASDATRFIELGADSLSASGDLNFGDAFGIGVLKIGATNIEDADAGDIPAPPANFLYRIYDNIDAPVSVQPSLVGMHFTDADSLGDVQPPSGPDWYSLVDATNPASMYQGINLTGQPVVDGNRVGAVLDTSGNGNHWRAWDGDASRTEYKSAGGGYIEITDNYTRGMAIDGTNRLVDVRKPFWVAMVVKRGGPINAHAVLMDKDYSENAPLGDQLAAGLDSVGLFCEKLIDDTTIGPIVNADAITTSAWGVVSFGYDGTNLTARVNLNTKGSVADTRPLPDEDGDMVLRLGGNTPSILHYKAVGFLDYYPDPTEEVAAIQAVASIAGLTL